MEKLYPLWHQDAVQNGERRPRDPPPLQALSSPVTSRALCICLSLFLGTSISLLPNEELPCSLGFANPKHSQLSPAFPQALYLTHKSSLCCLQIFVDKWTHRN